MGKIAIESNDTVNVRCSRDLARLLRRLQSLDSGNRYHLIVELDRRTGASWTITGAGKIERGLRQNAAD